PSRLGYCATWHCAVQPVSLTRTRDEHPARRDRCLDGLLAWLYGSLNCCRSWHSHRIHHHGSVNRAVGSELQQGTKCAASSSSHGLSIGARLCDRIRQCETTPI